MKRVLSLTGSSDLDGCFSPAMKPWAPVPPEPGPVTETTSSRRQSYVYAMDGGAGGTWRNNTHTACKKRKVDFRHMTGIVASSPDINNNSQGMAQCASSKAYRKLKSKMRFVHKFHRIGLNATLKRKGKNIRQKLFHNSMEQTYS